MTGAFKILITQLFDTYRAHEQYVYAASQEIIQYQIWIMVSFYKAMNGTLQGQERTYSVEDT